jgi:hypothetical protein
MAQIKCAIFEEVRRRGGATHQGAWGASAPWDMLQTPARMRLAPYSLLIKHTVPPQEFDAACSDIGLLLGLLKEAAAGNKVGRGGKRGAGAALHDNGYIDICL